MIRFSVIISDYHCIQDREPLAQFLVRLCAGVGGLVACSKMVCHLLKSLVEMYCCRIGSDSRDDTRRVNLTSRLFKAFIGGLLLESSMDLSTLSSAYMGT